MINAKGVYTCDVQMGIARRLAHFVRNDSFVDTSMSVTSTPDDQTVDIPV